MSWLARLPPPSQARSLPPGAEVPLPRRPFCRHRSPGRPGWNPRWRVANGGRQGVEGCQAGQDQHYASTGPGPTKAGGAQKRAQVHYLGERPLDEADRFDGSERVLFDRMPASQTELRRYCGDECDPSRCRPHDIAVGPWSAGAGLARPVQFVRRHVPRVAARRRPRPAAQRRQRPGLGGGERSRVILRPRPPRAPNRERRPIWTRMS